MLQAGASIVTITPPLGTPIAGLFHYRAAATVADDLTVRSLVLDDGTTRVAVVVCDLISLKAETIAAARTLIASRCDIPGHQVMIACTHTHTGPATSGHFNMDADPSYLDWVAGRIADGVTIAVSRLVPARVAHGAAIVDGVCFNRRYHMRDGTVRFNPGIRNPDILGPAGPTDPAVTALLVESMEGDPLAMWASLSTHYVGTDDELALSADYYGLFARTVERWLGSPCVGILANGTSGNINTIDVEQALAVKGTARARLIATAVAATAIQAVLMQRRDAAPTLAAETFPFQVTRRSISPDDVALARSILARPDGDEPAAEDGFSFVAGQPIPGPLLQMYAHGVLELAQKPAEASVELQILRVGDLTIVALPGEIFVEFGLAIKAHADGGRVVVVGLANDHIGYVPTRAAYSQGGYETWPTPTSWSAPGTGEAMTEAVVARLRSR